jgi:tRNA 5-methylaminomethyl-2-thiouridine biosynthesis bifunctional protein
MIRYADVTWSADATPESAAYGDVYFMRGKGRAECEHVFLQGNHLPNRWVQAPHFTIGETGFGTGLNFLHSWQRFEETALPDARLTFISVEKHPLHPHAIARAHTEDAGLAPYVRALLAEYPLPVAGWHRLALGRVTLLLGFGDAQALFADFDAAVDAWYLDGFAPAKNPDMWRPELFSELARLSAPGATLASFTAAGEVRRGLQAAGFAVERIPGFANKRHMTRGHWPGGTRRISAITPRHIAVIGGGIAGTSVAHALAEKGCEVTLYERESIAGGASGNPAAVLYPQLMAQANDPRMGWSMNAYALLQRRIQTWLAPGDYATCGMLKTPKDAKEETRLRTACALQAPEVVRYVERAEASALLGVSVPQGGAWFAEGAWIVPPALCHALQAHPRIVVKRRCAIAQIEPRPDGVRLTDASGKVAEADAVVLANGMAAAEYVAHLGTLMRPSAGQISQVPAAHIAQMPRAILCHRGYLIPRADTLLMGATYERENLSCDVTDAGHAHNAAEAEVALPGIFAQKDTAQWGGRVSLRATTFDRMPLVGEVAPRVWVSTGHGSRGMLSGPFAAEIIAAQMMGEPVPAARTLLRAMHPSRTPR